LYLADALFAQEKYQDAAMVYEQYLATRPDDVHALTNLGITQIAFGRLDRAIDVFRRAVAADPKNANTRRILGMALMDRGDPEAAAAEARAGLQSNPDDPALRELAATADAAGRGRK